MKQWIKFLRLSKFKLKHYNIIKKRKLNSIEKQNFDKQLMNNIMNKLKTFKESNNEDLK